MERTRYYSVCTWKWKSEERVPKQASRPIELPGLALRSEWRRIGAAAARADGWRWVARRPGMRHHHRPLALASRFPVALGECGANDGVARGSA